MEENLLDQCRYAPYEYLYQWIFVFVIACTIIVCFVYMLCVVVQRSERYGTIFDCGSIE